MTGARAATLVSLISIAALVGPPGAARAADGPAPVPPLEDNSFLLEEAYNQEPRVVQHILNWAYVAPAQDYALTFSQEWPVFGQRHQLSYAIPFESLDLGGFRGAGFGDVEIQYRYQWLGMGDSRLAAAPALTLQLPTGDPGEGLGAGSVAGKAGLPLSAKASSRLVAHTNLGVTWTGDAGDTPAAIEYELGQSLVWLAWSRFNPLVELVWSRSGPADGGTGDREEFFVVSPGFRWGHDFDNGLQIVPGVAFPIGIGASAGDSGVLLYLSFEHGF